jgi:Acetyltransferase (GNAT) domain
MECLEFGTPFTDELTIPKDVLAKEKILVYQVGYAFLGKAWGRGYTTGATQALLEAFVNSRGFWNTPFEEIYWQTATGVANPRSKRVLEKLGFKLKGIHRWDGANVFIGVTMQRHCVPSGWLIMASEDTILTCMAELSFTQRILSVRIHWHKKLKKIIACIGIFYEIQLQKR